MDFAQLNRRRHGERRFTCRLVWAPWLAGLLVCSTLWLTPARARGPSSSLYGTNAFFAVVNVITSDVHHFQGMALAGETDGFGTYKGRSTYGQRLHGVDLFLSGTAYDSGGPARLFFPAFDSPSTNYGYALHADHDSSGSFFGRLSFGHFTLESAGSTREKQITKAAFNTLFGDPRTHTADARG